MKQKPTDKGANHTGNNIADVTTEISPVADLAIDKTSGSFFTEPGGTITYTIEVIATDDGSPALSDATTVTVTVDEVRLTHLDRLGLVLARLFHVAFEALVLLEIDGVFVDLVWDQRRLLFEGPRDILLVLLVGHQLRRIERRLDIRAAQRLLQVPATNRSPEVQEIAAIFARYRELKLTERRRIGQVAGARSALASSSRSPGPSGWAFGKATS